MTPTDHAALTRTVDECRDTAHRWHAMASSAQARGQADLARRYAEIAAGWMRWAL